MLVASVAAISRARPMCLDAQAIASEVRSDGSGPPKKWPVRIAANVKAANASTEGRPTSKTKRKLAINATMAHMPMTILAIFSSGSPILSAKVGATHRNSMPVPRGSRNVFRMTPATCAGVTVGVSKEMVPAKR